uniref:Uncharacterized protein n=1 Tax=Brassica oleracea TaxID=3712 RepID=A0A3P6DWL0_BRAOL|nr:unnamed protein product [Brassica oleracea]
MLPAVYDSTESHKVTLALDGRYQNWYYRSVNSIIDAWRYSSLPSPFRTYPKQNPRLLGREYLNRANHSVDIFTEQNN